MGSKSAPQTPHFLLVDENPCDWMPVLWICLDHFPPKSPQPAPASAGQRCEGDFEVTSFLLFQGAIYRGTCCQEIDGQKGWISYCIVRGESLDPSRSVAKFPSASMRAGIPLCSLLHWMHFHMERLCHSQTDVKFSFSFSTHTTGTRRMRSFKGSGFGVCTHLCTHKHTHTPFPKGFEILQSCRKTHFGRGKQRTSPQAVAAMTCLPPKGLQRFYVLVLFGI